MQDDRDSIHGATGLDRTASLGVSVAPAALAIVAAAEPPPGDDGLVPDRRSG